MLIQLASVRAGCAIAVELKTAPALRAVAHAARQNHDRQFEENCFFLGFTVESLRERQCGVQNLNFGATVLPKQLQTAAKSRQRHHCSPDFALASPAGTNFSETPLMQ